MSNENVLAIYVFSHRSICGRQLNIGVKKIRNVCVFSVVSLGNQCAYFKDGRSLGLRWNSA